VPRSGDAETLRVRAIYDKMAPYYDRIIGVVERLLFADGRQWACTQATGRVLEVAIGTGRNLPWYPATWSLWASMSARTCWMQPSF
jgi:hypothetical protein